MKTELNFFHLLVVPIVAWLTVPVPLGVIFPSFLGFTEISLQVLSAFVMILYGLYLQIFRKHEKDHWGVWLLMGLIGMVLARFAPPVVFFIGFAFLFSLMRMTILELDWKTFPKNVLAVALGAAAVFLIAPLNWTASVVAFLLVQLICEMKFLEKETSGTRDRFRESLKTAERALKQFNTV